jgi:hypothetical protein
VLSSSLCHDAITLETQGRLLVWRSTSSRWDLESEPPTLRNPTRQIAQRRAARPELTRVRRSLAGASDGRTDGACGACAVGSIGLQVVARWQRRLCGGRLFLYSFRPRQHTLVGGRVPQTSGRQYNILSIGLWLWCLRFGLWLWCLRFRLGRQGPAAALSSLRAPPGRPASRALLALLLLRPRLARGHASAQKTKITREP